MVLLAQAKKLSPTILRYAWVVGSFLYWDRRRCGFEDPPWTLIGMYTRGRLLALPRSG